MLGIVGCGLVSHIVSAIAVIPGTFAISLNAGAVAKRKGASWSPVTTWQGVQVCTAKARPCRGSPPPGSDDCAIAPERISSAAARAPPASAEIFQVMRAPCRYPAGAPFEIAQRVA